MHPDLKIGLALAMLIVGFAGAMCFRHRPAEPAALSADSEQALDLEDDLELLPVRTYQPEPENATTQEETAIAVADSIDPASDGEANVETIVLDPIGTAATQVQSSPPETPIAEASQTSTQGVELAPSTYVVRPGDTLSGISSRMLGSTQRYLEIFEANRDLLNSPDDLQPGMELTIPPKDRPPTAIEQESPSPTDDQDQEPESPPATARPFIPMIPR